MMLRSMRWMVPGLLVITTVTPTIAQVRSRNPYGGPPASAYSNGYGTNAANSEAVGRPVGPDGGYVVNQYGFGNYVSGPDGFGGYPNGSADAQIWKQRQQWKCQNVPESC